MDQDGDPMGNLKPEILQVYIRGTYRKSETGDLEDLKSSRRSMGNLKPEILKEI